MEIQERDRLRAIREEKYARLLKAEKLGQYASSSRFQEKADRIQNEIREINNRLYQIG